MKNNNENSTIILSYKETVFIFLSLIISFSCIISYGFYHLKKMSDSLELSIQKNNVFLNKAITELRNENLALKQELLEGKEEALLNLLPATGFFTIDIVKLVLICLSVVAILIGAYYFTIFFFKKTFVGLFISWLNLRACSTIDKLFGGPGAAKTFVIQFDESFELKVILTEDSRCAMMFRTSEDSSFLPFEIFLEEYRDLLSSKIDVSGLQKALSEGNSSNILEVISNNPEITSEVTLKGLEAVKVFL